MLLFLDIVFCLVRAYVLVAHFFESVFLLKIGRIGDPFILVLLIAAIEFVYASID